MTLLSFHNDPAIKAKYLGRVERHAELDEIIQGTYWEHGKGCAVGCTIHSSEHDYYESELGLPEWLAMLEDVIFEGLPNVEAKSFPAAFLAAIRPGSDLTPVRHRFLAFLMRENLDRVEALELEPTLKSQATETIRAILQLHTQALIGPSAVAPAEAAAARSVQWLAVQSARSAESVGLAESAGSAWSAESAVESAAWSVSSVTWSVSSAASSAAWSVALAAARFVASESDVAPVAESAAQSAYTRYRNELLRLLKEA